MLESIFYLITVIGLAVSFMLFKKSEEKQNFLKWLVIFIITFMGYNVTLGMILGLIGIKCSLWLLGIINVIINYLLYSRKKEDEGFQKYEFPVRDRVALVLLLILFTVMLFKDIRVQDGGIKFAAIDSGIHYRAAKHYADNLKIFVQCEDKTIFDFNVMQTGAYINDGIYMRVVNSLTGAPHEYLYESFEILMLALNLFAFYVLIADKIKGKFGFIITMLVLMPLYIYAYPYNSYMYGFSYLSLGVNAFLGIMLVLDLFYKECKKDWFVITLVVLNSMLLIFSYCLFVPGVFAAICLYTWVKDFWQKDEKKILKIFKKRTLILTGILLLVTALGIGYLVVPTFFIAGQSNLKDALLNDGGMYKNLCDNFVIYIPFGILFIVDLILRRKELKEGKFNVLTFFTIMIPAYFFVMWVGMRMAIMSTYYFFKIYYILWPVVIATVIDLFNRYSEKKLVGKIILGLYICLWGAFVVTTILVKASNLFPEQKFVMKNRVGVYFDQNCDYRGLIQAYNNLAKEQIAVINEMNKIEDLTADNITLISGSYYERTWAVALGDLTSEKLHYSKILQDTTPYTIQDGLDNPNTKYVVRVNESYDLTELEETGKTDGFKILFKNSRGYILEKTK